MPAHALLLLCICLAVFIEATSVTGTARQRRLLSFDSAEPFRAYQRNISDTEPISLSREEDLCIVCFERSRNTDFMFIQWTPEEWKEMKEQGLDLKFPDCHGSELCSGCLVAITCTNAAQCPVCRSKPESPRLLSNPPATSRIHASPPRPPSLPQIQPLRPQQQPDLLDLDPVPDIGRSASSRSLRAPSVSSQRSRSSSARRGSHSGQGNQRSAGASILRTMCCCVGC